MTNTRKLNSETGTPFGKWLRDQPELDSKEYGLSIQNLDYVVHRYKNLRRNQQDCQCVMLVEEKRFQGQSSKAQKDTHGVIDKLLRLASGAILKLMRGKFPVHYFGYHVLQFENETPDDGRMWWDSVEIDTATLFKLVRFEIDPCGLGKRN